jgi:aspartate/methionine/tyrosine aminotransferase
MAGMSIFSKISSPADVVFSSLLSSEHLSTYLLISQERLQAAHELVETWFSARGCTVHRCDAGPFLWVYMGDRLGITTWEEEARLHMRLFEEGGVYIVSIVDTRPSCDSPRASLTESRPFVFLCPKSSICSVLSQSLGATYKSERPGYFRITFAVPKSTLLEGLGRMEKILGLRIRHKSTHEP